MSSTFDFGALHLEDERRVGRDCWRRSRRAVGHVRWNYKLPFLSDADAQQTTVPALNHLAGAERKAERRSALVRAIELCARRVQQALEGNEQLSFVSKLKNCAHLVMNVQ